MRVCILGENLTSLTLAKALINLKIQTDIVSNYKSKHYLKSRSLGISQSNLDFFNYNILDIKKLSWKINKIEIFTDNLKKEKLINFENNDNELFSIIRNQNLFDVLEKSLSKDKYFKKINFLKSYTFLDNYNLVINTDFSSSIFFHELFYNNKLKNLRTSTEVNNLKYFRRFYFSNDSLGIEHSYFLRYKTGEYFPLRL